MHHLRQRHQQARHDAAEEQVADRGVGDERVEHHRDRRRDDRPDDGGDGGQRRGIARRDTCRRAVIMFCIILPVPAASAMAEPDMPAKMMRLQDVDLREAAAEAADEGVAEVSAAARSSSRCS